MIHAQGDIYIFMWMGMGGTAALGRGWNEMSLKFPSTQTICGFCDSQMKTIITIIVIMAVIPIIKINCFLLSATLARVLKAL